MNSQLVLQLLLIVFLTLLNAFFASAEMAIVSLNKNKIKVLAESGNKKAQLLEILLVEPSRLLSTVQVGITLAGFFSSASAATGLADDFEIVLSRWNIPYSHQLSLILITISLSYFILVFGELVPKNIALKKAETIALFVVRPIIFISKITSPFVRLLSVSSHLVMRLFGLHKGHTEEQISEAEIRSILESSHEQGNIHKHEKDMIHSIFEFNDKSAYEVMTPRMNVFLIDINKPFSVYLEEIITEKRYSRIPVYEESSDNIIGVLYLKDLLNEAYKNGFENIQLKDILHRPFFVNQTKRIHKLFKELQSSNKHMAILIDEFGGFSGIVTIEDLIEEIMGNIDDEYD